MKMKKKGILSVILISAILLNACSISDAKNILQSKTGAEEEAPTEITFDDTPGDAGKDREAASVETTGETDAMIVVGQPETVPGQEVSDPEPDPNDFEGYILSGTDTPENGVYCKSVQTPGEVGIVFGGDIDFDGRYANMNALKSRGGDISSVLSPNLLSLLRDTDICMLNNEFPYSSRGTPTAGKKFTFRADPSTVHYLTDMGADIVGLANNHAYDHGPDALLDTFDTLDSEGIPYVGAGRNIEEAKKPVYFIAGGMKIAFVAATQIERLTPPDTKEATETDPGVLRTMDPAKFLSVIETAESNSDFVIVFVHWGTENKNDYEASQRELAVQYAAAGADLIIGAHPHVLQGFDYADGVPVMYSLGNFWFNSKTLDNCAVKVVLKDKSIKSLQFIPCQQKNCTTTMFEPGSSEFTRIIRQMRTFSSDSADIDDEGYVNYTPVPTDRPKEEASASSKPAPAAFASDAAAVQLPDQAAIDAALAAAAAAAAAGEAAPAAEAAPAGQ